MQAVAWQVEPSPYVSSPRHETNHRDIVLRRGNKRALLGSRARPALAAGQLHERAGADGYRKRQAKHIRVPKPINLTDSKGLRRLCPSSDILKKHQRTERFGNWFRFRPQVRCTWHLTRIATIFFGEHRNSRCCLCGSIAPYSPLLNAHWTQTLTNFTNRTPL